MLGYGIQETNAVDVHEVIEYGDFLVSIKDFLGTFGSMIGSTR